MSEHKDTESADVPTPINTESASVASFGIVQLVGVTAFVSLVIMSIGFASYHYFMKKHTSPFGTVDIENIVEINQMRLVAMVSAPGAGDKERGLAFDAAKSFGQKMTDAISQVETECGCVLLARAAVIGSSQNDYTVRTKEILGMGNLDLDSMKKQFHDSMMKGVDELTLTKKQNQPTEGVKQ